MRPSFSKSRLNFSNWGRICSPESDAGAVRFRHVVAKSFGRGSERRREHEHSRGHSQQPGVAGFRSIGAGPSVRKPARGAAGLHEPSTGLAAEFQSTSGRASWPPSSRGKLAVFLFFHPAEQSARSGFQRAGARFAGGKSFGRAIGVCGSAERPSTNRRFPYGGIERRLQHGCAVEHWQLECDRLISRLVPPKITPILIRPCGLRYTGAHGRFRPSAPGNSGRNARARAP